jgi:hypothetical protein
MGLLRGRVSAARSRAAGAASGARASSVPAGAASAALVQRLRGIDPNDPQRQHTAVRMFLESELAREWGDAILNDPGFPQMMQSVQAQLTQDPQLAGSIDALGDWLIAGAAKG